MTREEYVQKYVYHDHSKVRDWILGKLEEKPLQIDTLFSSIYGKFRGCNLKQGWYHLDRLLAEGYVQMDYSNPGAEHVEISSLNKAIERTQYEAYNQRRR